jgi:hypothetical protein
MIVALVISRQDIYAELRCGAVPSKVQKIYSEIPDEHLQRT